MHNIRPLVLNTRIKCKSSEPLIILVVSISILWMSFSGCIGISDKQLSTSPIVSYSNVPIFSDNTTVPNKWAILGVDAKVLSVDFVPSMEVVFEVLSTSLGFPKEHIFILSSPSIKINSNYTREFTKKNIMWCFERINQLSSDPANATIMLYFGSHGVSPPFDGSGIYIPDDGKYHSGFFVFDVPGKYTPLWDYELYGMLNNYTSPTQKIIVTIDSCTSGCFAAQDTTGMLHGALDILFTPCSGPNRVIITASTAPLDVLLPGVGDLPQYFWKEGLAEGKGDTNPINGNNDGKTSVEEAWFYYKSRLTDLGITTAQPCMNDQYPAENPEEEMFLQTA